MPITVVISNADGIIHGTDNGKKTGCGIKYNSGDNLRKYKQGEVLTDLIIAMKTLNCEKCRRILSTKMIKEDRKAENKREKEERKRIAEAIKRGELDADGNPIVKNTEETTENVQEQEVETSPQEVAQPTPTVEPIAQNEPVEQSVVETDTSNQTISQPTIDAQTKYQTEDEEISQYIEEPQPEPIKTAPVVDDDLAQFMVNPEELKASEPEPVAPKKPLTDINDILADLDALMSNMSIKKNDPIDIKKDFTPIQEDTSYSEELPTIDEVTPTQEDTSYSEELPTIDEVIPTQEDTSYSEELPTIDEVIPTQDDTSYSEELPTIDEVIPTQDDTSYSEELPTIDEVIPTQEDTSYSEELPTIDEIIPTQDDTSYSEELPTIDEVIPTQDVSSYSEELPTIDEVIPTQEDTSYSEELPTIDEVIPTQDVSSYSEELPTIDEVIPTQDVSSYSEELPTIDEVIPTQDVSSYSEELPTIDEVIPTQEDTSYSEELPTIDEVAPIQEDTSYTEELPTIDEVAPIQEVNNTIPTTNIPTGYPNIPQNQPTYTQPVVPTPMPQPTPIPQYYYNVYGEAIPITYNAQNQPVFTVPVTYDAQGQPRPVQMAQPTPSPYIQQNPYMSNQPTYVQPVQPQQNVVPNPPPTRVVRADAPPKVSKPVENKPFDFSIFEKEDKKPVFTASENRIFVDSIEEALSQLGVETDSSKDKENEVVPEFQEYVAPTKSSKPVTPKQETPKTAPVLSEAERKKREKMDAKLKKEWEKKGLDPNDWKRRKHI